MPSWTGFSPAEWGDGTTWSGERGIDPLPKPDGQAGGGSSGGSGGKTPGEKQLDAVYADAAVMSNLKAIQKKARLENPNAKLTIESIDVNGTLSFNVSNFRNITIKEFGVKEGGAVGFPDGSWLAWGKMDTGHTRPQGGNTAPTSTEIDESALGVTLNVLAGDIPLGYTMQDGKVGLIKDKYTRISTGHGEYESVYAGKFFVEIPELTKAYDEGVKQRLAGDTNTANINAAKAAAEEAATAKERQAAINAATAAGQNMTVAQAKASLNSATSEASSAKTAASNASATATQKQKAAAAAKTAAEKAEKTYKDILDKTTGKSPAGTGYRVKNGKIGYNRTITKDTAEHTITYTTWVSTGITVAQRDAAQVDATNKRNTANTLAAEAVAAATASTNAATAAKNAETRRQAAIAALAAAQKVADATAKAAAAAKEAAAAKAAAEKARALQERQTVADTLKTSGIQAVRGIPSNPSMAVTPISWSLAGMGGIALDAEVGAGVLTRISAVLADLRAIAAASVLGPFAATIAGLLFPNTAGDPSDSIVPGRDLSSMIPGKILSLPDVATLNIAADKKTHVSMPIRGRMVLTDEGVLETQLVRTPVVGTVPVVRAVLDKTTGYYGYSLPAVAGVPSQRILISPADAPGTKGQLTLTGPVPLPERILHTGDQDVINNDETTISPVGDDIDFNDVILIFPADSGLDPIYIMYRDPRNMPGTASGKGEKVGSDWRAGENSGNGSPIPSQVADKLRGKNYSNFAAFRRAVWKATSSTPELRELFKEQNKGNIDGGNSPFASKKEQVGGRKRLELHHVVPISKGGALYDVDNIRIMTPKRHIEVHKGGK